jgi:hypothetical protein
MQKSRIIEKDRIDEKMKTLVHSNQIIYNPLAGNKRGRSQPPCPQRPSTGYLDKGERRALSTQQIDHKDQSIGYDTSMAVKDRRLSPYKGIPPEADQRPRQAMPQRTQYPLAAGIPRML